MAIRNGGTLISGGTRRGAGRPKGSLGDRNKSLLEAQQKALVDGKIDASKVLIMLYRRALDKQDVAAAHEFCNRWWGRAPQLITLQGSLNFRHLDRETRQNRIRELLAKGRQRRGVARGRPVELT